jgi:site-specific DNA-methyltransferase (adenine-specific)
MIQLMQGDCLEKMKEIPDRSVDMILTDPPYGTTACKWDSIIPLEPMWEQLKRVIKPNGAIVLCGGEPFSSNLRLSNIDMWKYDWKWRKNRPVGFVNAKLKPLKAYEDILVFSDGKTSNGNKNNMPYNPQGLIACDRKGTRSGNSHGQNDYHRPSHDNGYKQEWTNYPTDVLEVEERGAGKKIHPTQKPVSLMEYLIKTYTNEGETVLDFTMGSGTTGVAAKSLNRSFIGIELDDEYFKIAEKRIKEQSK